MFTLNNIPVIEITKENINSEFEKLLKEIETSTFISLDIEMSGLGNRKKLNSQLKLFSITTLQILNSWHEFE